MTKRILSLLLCALLLCTATAALAESYSATATGFNGDVTVTLSIEGDQLTDVTIEGAGETPTIGGAAIEQLVATMLECNSVDVDGVAGATFSSTAALEAAAQALAASGAVLTPNEVKAAEAAPAENETTDVLVIGGGVAGLSAAIAATEAGADVILVEKLAFLGGCSAMSGGAFTRAAVDSDEGETMEAQELYDFLMETAEQKADADLVRYYVDHSVDTFNWVYDNMVSHPENAYRYAMVPESIVTMRLPGKGGELVGDMGDYAKKLGVDIRLQTTAKEFIAEDGKVVGAVVICPDGNTQNLYAESVVLATGGFAASPDMLAKYSTPGAEKIASNASPGTVGEGLDMAQAVGAEIFFNDDWDTCGSFSLAFTGYETGKLHYIVLLNAKGERFVNETNIQPYIYTVMRHELAKGYDNTFWFLVDENIEENTQWLIDNAGAQRAETVEELAAITGIDADVLQTTIDAYNATAGTDNDEFGKPASYNKGLQAPYTVGMTQPIRTTTIGGLKINTNCEVLSESGEVILGLYAAGEVANANFYYVTYTCGTAFGGAIIFGRAAGTNAAAAALAE